jgi:hypothetical protein
MFVKEEPAVAMMLSLYVTLGIFLLLASRNPSANRSLIAFTAWSSFAHAVLMAGQAFANLIARGELIGSVVLVVIGVAYLSAAERCSCNWDNSQSLRCSGERVPRHERARAELT